ncbi:MAG: hypothetical protein LBD44_05100 [Spirochaetaceae bacterium]|jgi:hypothetical protein|nr:hypothetical protein [Spirochaetaceae bacterium]
MTKETAVQKIERQPGVCHASSVKARKIAVVACRMSDVPQARLTAARRKAACLANFKSSVLPGLPGFHADKPECLPALEFLTEIILWGGGGMFGHSRFRSPAVYSNPQIVNHTSPVSDFAPSAANYASSATTSPAATSSPAGLFPRRLDGRLAEGHNHSPFVMRMTDPAVLKMLPAYAVNI